MIELITTLKPTEQITVVHDKSSLILLRWNYEIALTLSQKNDNNKYNNCLIVLQVSEKDRLGRLDIFFFFSFFSHILWFEAKR